MVGWYATIALASLTPHHHQTCLCADEVDALHDVKLRLLRGRVESRGDGGEFAREQRGRVGGLGIDRGTNALAD